MGQVGNWVFIAFFIAQGWRCLSGANRSFLGRRSISLANYHLLGPPAVHPSLRGTFIGISAYIKHIDPK
jgi:homoaconitase/3-isopropylmalate dehydratase large subunit